MRSPTILYETDDVIVTCDLRQVDEVVVGFAYSPNADTVAPFGDGMVQEFGYAGIFVTAKAYHWWQLPDRERLVAVLKAAIAPYRKATAYGISMGAYGALSMGRAIGCQRIVAIAPQTVISDARVPLHPRWSAHLSERAILHDDIVGDLGDLVPEIIYDQNSPFFRQHADYLKKNHPVLAIRYPFVGQAMRQIWRDIGMLRPAMEAILGTDAANRSVRRMFREKRGKSLVYLTAAARYCLDRHDLKAAERFRERAREAGGEEGAEQVQLAIDHYLAKRAAKVAALPSAGKLKTHLVAIIRNGRRDIGEWLLFHSMLGFDRITIYDHLSADGMSDEIDRVAKLCAAEIEVIPWTDTHRPQGTAYIDAISNEADGGVWLCFLDGDEFLVLPKGQRVADFIGTLGNHKAVAFNWRCFGSSGHRDYPDGIVAQEFQWRAPEDYSANRHTKVLMQREVIAGFRNPHCMFLTEGDYVHPDLTPVVWGEKPGKLDAAISGQDAFVIHYESRSRAHYEAKLSIPRASKAEIWKEDRWTAIDRNDIYDTVMFDRYGPQLDEIARLLGRPIKARGDTPLGSDPA
jgi:hypothetical protein